MKILEQLCALHGTSGDEFRVRDFVLAKVIEITKDYQGPHELWYGDGCQDNLAVIFGTPKIAYYAHMDTVGYTVRYDNYVVPIGGTDGKTGDTLVYESEGKWLETKLIMEESEGEGVLMLVDSKTPISPGTTLTYKPGFQLTEDQIQSPYLDNRLGVWALLQLMEKEQKKELRNVAFVFTTYEEHGGGAAGFLARRLYKEYKTDKAIIVDITWATNGVFPGKGPAISLRDSRIPRKSFVNSIVAKAKAANISFQQEVEYHGGSDGREIQNLPYPIDWIFIGPPSDNQHSSLETVNRGDVEGFVELLRAVGT